MPHSDSATSFTTSSGPSSPSQQTVRITGVAISNLMAFLVEHNITLPAEYTGAALITSMRNFIAYKVDANVLRTTARIPHNGKAIISIKLATTTACRHALEILSQSRAFDGCNIQCLED
ncbi:hypothetical protein HOY82DRAFT_604887 [Tuber indicum]|nr:hypothetical protein HOY82DRAFT_604887 [Tuber indicum]